MCQNRRLCQDGNASIFKADRLSFCSGVLACMAWSVSRLVGRSVVLEVLVGKELRVEPRLEAMAMKAHAKWVRPSRPVPEIWVHGTTEGPATVEEVSSEDELEDITPVMEEVWTPPYHAPESTWKIPGPLDHAQTPCFTFCLLCEKWCSAGHLMSAGHSSAMQRWMRSGKPLLQIPLRFAEDEQVEMLIQSRHPTWSRRTTLAAKQAILQMAYYRAQEGTFRGEIPPEMDENLEKVLEEVREHLSADEAWGTWRASSDLRRPVTPPRRPVTPPKQPPRQKAKVEPSPVLQPPLPVPAEAPPLGVPSFDSGPDVLVDPNAGAEGRCSVQHPVGAKLPSERRVGPPIGGGERGMADSAEPGASCAAKGGEQIIANATSGTYTVPPPPAPTSSTNLPPPASSSSTTTPWSHLPGFGNLLPPPQVPKEPPRDP